MFFSVLVVMVTGCTFMAFVSVSGDFCQAQHLVIVDKWREWPALWGQHCRVTPLEHSTPAERLLYPQSQVYAVARANPAIRKPSLFCFVFYSLKTPTIHQTLLNGVIWNWKSEGEPPPPPFFLFIYFLHFLFLNNRIEVYWDFFFVIFVLPFSHTP